MYEEFERTRKIPRGKPATNVTQILKEASCEGGPEEEEDDEERREGATQVERSTKITPTVGVASEEDTKQTRRFCRLNAACKNTFFCGDFKRLSLYFLTKILF